MNIQLTYLTTYLLSQNVKWFTKVYIAVLIRWSVTTVYHGHEKSKMYYLLISNLYDSLNEYSSQVCNV